MPADRATLARWAPAVAWAGVIFLASTSWFDGARTGPVAAGLLGDLFPGADPHLVEAAHLGARKLGHLGEYLILGVLVARALRGDGPWRPRHGAAAVAIAAAYAVTDEVHQAFVPGRTAAAADVLIDAAGAAAGQLALALRHARGR